MDSCILKVLQDITSRAKYFCEPHYTVVVLFPGKRGTFFKHCTTDLFLGSAKAVMILGEDCDRELVPCHGGFWSMCWMWPDS